jgi:hypothetical protein
VIQGRSNRYVAEQRLNLAQPFKGNDIVTPCSRINAPDMVQVRSEGPSRNRAKLKLPLRGKVEDLSRFLERDSLGASGLTNALSSCFLRETQKHLLERFALRRNLPHAKAVLDQQGIHERNLFVSHLHVKRFVAIAA